MLSQRVYCIGWFVLNWTEQKDVDGLCTDHTWEFFWRTLRILRAVVESSPEVGSSRKRMEGSTSISYPILVRLRSPPDTPRMKGPPILVFLHLRSKLERERPKPNFTKFVSMMSRIYSYLDFYSFLFWQTLRNRKDRQARLYTQLCIFCEIGINFCGDNQSLLVYYCNHPIVFVPNLSVIKLHPSWV